MDGMVGDVRQHMPQPSVGINIRSNSNGGSTFVAAVGAGEQVIAAPNGHAAQCAFSWSSQ
jgi:hypothetical protein